MGAVPVARSGRDPGWPGCGVPAGLAGVRRARDHAAHVCDRIVALVPVLVGGRGAWDQATRAEARDFSRWIQIAVKPGRAGDAATADIPARAAPARAGVPNPVTGKARPGSGYAPATVTHSESVLRGFYDFHCEAGTGPIVNPFPLARARRGRAHAHHNPMEPFRGERSGRYRPQLARRAPHHIPEEKFNELFAALARTATGHWWHSGYPPGRARPSCSARRAGMPIPGSS